MRRLLGLGCVLWASQAHAQPVRGADPEARARAGALTTEGQRQLQALANFLEAYGTLPSPEILLDGWLVTGRQYTTDDASSATRHVLASYGGRVVAPIVPSSKNVHDGTAVDQPRGRRITPGLLGMARIDGKGRGLAGGLGLVLSPLDSVELELAGLRARSWGIYAGIRVRLLTGRLRPYVGGGVPVFFFTDDATMESAVALGLRGAGGIEVRITEHVSVQADLGIEHFFDVDDVLVDDKQPDSTIFVPTVGVIARR